MKPEEQRIAIAESLGWKDLKQKWEGFPMWHNLDSQVRYGHLHDKCACLPDYLNDLNACHEMEKSLTQDEARAYTDFLSEMPQTGTWAGCSMWHFVAPHRCESFLRAKGLWKEAE